MDGPNLKIRDCIRHGDLERMKELLKGRKLNSPLDGKWTPLLYGCLDGQDTIVDYLLQNGALVDHGFELFTPLMAVCNSDSSNIEKLVSCAKSLLECGADPNAMDKYKSTPLMYASAKGHEQLVSVLLSTKCEVNKFDNEGSTALHSACSSNHPNIVKLLLHHGADKNMKDRRSRLPIALATAKGAVEIIEMLDEPELDHESKSTEIYVKKRSSFEELLTQLPSYNDVSGESGFHSDIEMLLTGMGLEQYADLFRFKKVSFTQFLNCKNDVLKHLGVHFSSHRKRIVGGNKRFVLHPWGQFSVREVNNNSLVELMDIVRSLANTVKQLHIMWATSVYCNERVVLQTDEEDLKVDDLFEVVLRTRRQTKALIQELKLIQEKVEYLDKVNPVQPADLICPAEKLSLFSAKKFFLLSAFCVFAVWKTDLIKVFRK